MSPRKRGAPIPPPPLAERSKPGLVDTLGGIEHPARCRACGTGYTKGNPLRRFIECDAFDKVPPLSECRALVLCSQCWDRIGEPHPRAYHELVGAEPYPGCMGVCVACTWRDGVRCTNPDAQMNGGEGLRYTWDAGKEPVRAHICGGPNAGLHTFYASPVRACTGRRTLQLTEGT